LDAARAKTVGEIKLETRKTRKERETPGQYVRDERIRGKAMERTHRNVLRGNAKDSSL